MPASTVAWKSNSVHLSDLSGQRLFRFLAELGLFERPIFHVERLGLADRLEAADRFRTRDGLDRALGEVRRDACVLLAAAQPEQAEARNEHDARQRVSMRLDELQRRIQVEAIAIGFAITALITLSYGLLGLVDIPQPNLLYVSFIMVVSWGLGKLWTMWKYR